MMTTIQRKMIFLALLCGVWGIATAPVALAQAHIADLIEDVNMLKHQMRRMQLDMEDLKKENAELRKLVDAQQTAYDRFLRTVQGQLATTREQLEAADRRIIAETTKQIEDLAAQTQRGFQALAQSVSSAPQPITATTTFSDDFPKTGVAYTVKPGDTLSQIAREHNSTVRWIQDANRIANPARDVRVGQNLFIPQKN
jgi:LysM repeat protein/FtsZ-binding cell division protein ZapB